MLRDMACRLGGLTVWMITMVVCLSRSGFPQTKVSHKEYEEGENTIRYTRFGVWQGSSQIYRLVFIAHWRFGEG